MAVRPIDAIELQKRMCALCNQDYADEPCEPSDCIFIRALNETPTLTQPNESLTLEELREMNGEPVWVKRLKGLSVCDTDWAVVEFRLEPDVKHYEIRVWWPGSEYEDTPSEDDYGKTWIAYRRPPEGEEEAP